MRTILNKCLLLISLACVPCASFAQVQSQTPSVEYGRTTITFSSDFLNGVASLGVSITDLNNSPLQNNAFTVRAVAGAVDLSSSAGEVLHRGGFVVNAGGVMLRIQNLTIDTTNLGAPVVTAEFIVNDHFAGRMALFNVQPPQGFALPLQLQAGVLQLNGMGLSLAQAAATEITNVFGTGVPAGTPIGTANTYVVFAAQN